MSNELLREMIINLMKSTAQYMCLRMNDGKFKTAYIESMKKCIALTQEDLSDFDLYRSNMVNRENYEAYNYQDTFWNKKTTERHYATLAARQALEIADSIYGRFITGMADTAPRKYKGKGLLLPVQEDLFK